jgi:hypothetical protein
MLHSETTLRLKINLHAAKALKCHYQKFKNSSKKTRKKRVLQEGAKMTLRLEKAIINKNVSRRTKHKRLSYIKYLLRKQRAQLIDKKILSKKSKKAKIGC